MTNFILGLIAGYLLGALTATIWFWKRSRKNVPKSSYGWKGSANLGAQEFLRLINKGIKHFEIRRSDNLIVVKISGSKVRIGMPKTDTPVYVVVEMPLSLFKDAYTSKTIPKAYQRIINIDFSYLLGNGAIIIANDILKTKMLEKMRKRF